MSNWFNKTFRKNVCVKVIYFGEGRKHKISYLIPKDSTVKIDGKAFMINKKDFFVDSKNFITYVFSFNRVEPIDPNRAKTLGTTTPADLGIALDSNVAEQILTASKGHGEFNLFMILLLVVMVLGFGLLYYLFTSELEKIYEILEPFKDVL